MTDMMSALDDNRSCVGLMSLDYSKAFNRMSHPFCLSVMARKGASSNVLAMTYAFLCERQMRVKIEGQFSAPRNTPGGAPQGTKSGNYLFSISADAIEEMVDHEPTLNGDSLDMVEVGEASAVDSGDENSRFDDTGDFSVNVARYDRRMLRVRNPLDDTAPHVLSQAWNRSRIEEALGVPDRWKSEPLGSYNYVDDQTILEKIPASLAVSSITTSKESRFVHASGLLKKFKDIKIATKNAGMELNAKKTQLLCVSDAKTFEINAYLNIDGEIIKGQECMKILGYVIGNKPNASAQVQDIKSKCNIRAWTIRHLKRAGVKQKDLAEIYTACIRSAVEYASNVYSGFLSKTQEEHIERLQANILRGIYDFKLSYRECLVNAGLPTLKARRELSFLKFSRRVETNERYRKRWLPPAHKVGYPLRAANKYKMTKPNCNRLENTPIFRVRKILNDLHRSQKNINVEIMELEEKILDQREDDIEITFIN